MEVTPKDHPLRSASWIWPECYLYLHNHYAQFRWDIELSEIASTVPFFITADKSYNLYVNGVFVCRGPARGYQSHWPYDEVDLQPWLKPGHNWISVYGYQTGCSTFGYLHQNYAGLLVATSDEALHTAIAAVKPIMRRSPGHLRQTERLSLQIDFQEHLDLRADDGSWITVPTPPTDWHPSNYLPVGHIVSSLPFGRHPYDSVEPRTIPLLREEYIVPQLPTLSATSASNDGYRETTNVSWHWVPESAKIVKWSEANVQSPVRTEENVTFTIPATGVGNFTAIVVPPGEYLLGVVEVKATGASGGEILDFHHDQFYRDGVPKHVMIGDGCYVAMGNRLILREGDNEHTFYHPLGFGAMILIARDLTAPLTVRLRIRKVGYPFTFAGNFECSDQSLNEIYAACRRTQQLCSMDAYVDTPWREQAQWWGDARVQAKNTFYMDGDARLLLRGIRSLAGQSVSGLTPGHAPTSSYWCVLPDFALTWILTVWDYYWQTGDKAVIAEQRNRIEEALAYFETPEARDASGLLKVDERWWTFEDWSTLPKEGILTFLNLWYLLTVRHIAKMYALLGLTYEAAKYAAVDAAQTALVEKHLVDSDTGLLVSALNSDGKTYAPSSVHDQVLALMLNISPNGHQRMMDDFLLPYLRSEKLNSAVPSAFWATYVLELAIARGEAEAAIKFIRDQWSPMMGTGTTWEGFEWHEESGGSSCHAWTSHPSFHFVNAIAGVFQTSAAWSDVLVKPSFLSSLDTAIARIPSPKGEILSEWHRENGKIVGRIALPEGVSGQLELPGRDPQTVTGEITYAL